MWLPKIVKISEDQSGLNDIQSWNSSVHAGDVPNYGELRLILGEMLNHLNDASFVYKEGTRGTITPEIQQKAMVIYDQIEHMSKIQEELKFTLDFLENQQITPQIQQLKSIVYSIFNMRFTENQARVFFRIGSGEINNRDPYLQEVNTARMQSFLQKAIYGAKNPTERTERVFREVLQNAADAAVRQKQIRASHIPQIDIYTKDYTDRNGENFMDLSIVDNGVGMDWQTLSTKFFIYFQSGKEESEATGGFGIAKAVIQETPGQGWSIDSNGIHASKFTKNIFMATPKDESSLYTPPYSHMQGQGTRMDLYKLPTVTNYTMVNLCKKFATEELVINFNGTAIDPLFKLSDLKPMGNDLNGIVQVVAESPEEERIAQDIIEKQKNELLSARDKPLGQLEYPGTTINCYLKKEEYSGRSYILLNGQYQYETGWVTKASIIVSIRTTVRPLDDNYPMEPGRDNLRSPYKEDVANMLMDISSILSKISENELFKEGINIVIFNENLPPLNVHEESPNEEKNEIKHILENARNIGHASAPGMFKEVDEEGNIIDDNKGEDENIEEKPQFQDSADLGREIERRSKDLSLNKGQQAIISAAIETLVRDKGTKIDVREELEKIIDGLTSPLVVTFQKNFASQELANDKPELTASLAILWQSIIRKIINRVSHRISRYFSTSYAPGLVWSDKALALYSSTKRVKYKVISINPVAVASIVQPDAFVKWLGDDKDKGAFEVGQDTLVKDLTPIARLSAFLFHAAVHEVTHLLYPDSYGFEEFHAYVTSIETLCHYLFDSIRDDVKRYMPSLKRDSLNIIRFVRDEKKKSVRALVEKWTYKFGEKDNLIPRAIPGDNLWSYSFEG